MKALSPEQRVGPHVAVQYQAQHGQKLGDEPEPMNSDAFYGIAGEFVRLVEPHTEACPEALLVQLLAGAGCIIGRGPHYLADGSEHHAAIYCVMVGDTSKARKGTSLKHVRRLLECASPVFMENNLASGLSSGEGLIYRVRDASVGAGGKAGDPGVADKRLLVIEDELARPLKVAERQGNTLSTFIRSAWDGTTIQTMTRTNPLQASGHHIVINAHVTREELLNVLGKSDLANGLANRFLWIHSKRSQCLPDGGGEYDIKPLGRCLRLAIERARQISRVRFDKAATEIWHEIYESLSEGHPGDLGKATSRSEAQVVRLALIYALLDSSEIISPKHLRAGLAVWNYAEFSAAYIFGSFKTDPKSLKVLAALNGPVAGLTRTDISAALGHHIRSDEIDRVLAYLKRQGLVSSVRYPTGGRPREVWFLSCEESERSELST